MYVSDSPAKRIYNTIIPSKWAEEFQDMDSTLYPTVWKETYTLPYLVARDTKLQAFQYRLIHRILPCNKYLAYIRIKSDDTCTFCQATDTLQHFFFICQPVNDLWNSLALWLTNNADLHIQFNAKEVLFGVPKATDQAPVVNFLILFTKYYIYRQRLFHQNQLALLQVLRELRLRLRVEKYINTQEGKQGKFRKWERILNALD